MGEFRNGYKVFKETHLFYWLYSAFINRTNHTIYEIPLK